VADSYKPKEPFIGCVFRDMGIVSTWDDLGGQKWSGFSTSSAVTGGIADKLGPP